MELSRRVLSPILFAFYSVDLLKRLVDTGVGFHMGCHFTGVLTYADDITLLAPCKSALFIMIDVCEQYAAEFDILFNGSKSKLLFFKGRYASAVTSCIKVNGATVHISDNAVHLTSDRLKDLISGLSKLIDIRDGYKECDRL